MGIFDEIRNSITELQSGIRAISSTPHPIKFIDEEIEVVTPPSTEEFKKLLSAKPVEKQVSSEGKIQFVRTEFCPSDDGVAFLRKFQEEFPQVVILSSIITAQAYGMPCVGIVPAKGYERVAPADKRFNPYKFNSY